MKYLISFLFLLGLASACVQSGTPASIPLPTQNLPITQMPSITPALTLTSNATVTETPMSAPIVPPVEKYCPSEREIALQDLELDRKTLLLVRPIQSQTQEVWTISGANLSPQPIPQTRSSTEWFYRFLGLSPDSKWLLFRRSNYPSSIQEYLFLIAVDGSAQYDILSFNHKEGNLSLQSANGKEEWVILKVDYGPRFYWSGENEITVEAQPIESTSLAPSYPVFTLDPFALEGRVIVASNETAGWNLGDQLGPDYSHADVIYEVYHGTFGIRKHPGFFLYDRADATSQPVFQWLNNETWIARNYETLRGFRYWQDQSGLVTMVITQPYGIDLATGLDFTTITQAGVYTSIMKPIIIPPGEGHLTKFRFPNLVIGWVSPDGFRFVLEHSSRDESNQFYIFDSQTMTLKDYCFLPRNEGSAIYASPDGKFLAWNVNIWDAERGLQGVKEIVVLELMTGRFARISDFEILDWSTKKP